MSKNILFYEIDVDESIELYIKFKKIKMVNSIPAILVYYPEEKIIGIYQMIRVILQI